MVPVRPSQLRIFQHSVIQARPGLAHPCSEGRHRGWGYSPGAAATSSCCRAPPESPGTPRTSPPAVGTVMVTGSLLCGWSAQHPEHRPRWSTTDHHTSRACRSQHGPLAPAHSSIPSMDHHGPLAPAWATAAALVQPAASSTDHHGPLAAARIVPSMDHHEPPPQHGPLPWSQYTPLPQHVPACPSMGCHGPPAHPPQHGPPQTTSLSPSTAWASWRAAGHWTGLGSGPEAKARPRTGSTSHEGPACSLPQVITIPAFTSWETEARSDSTLAELSLHQSRDSELGFRAGPGGINQGRGIHSSRESPGAATALGVQSRETPPPAGEAFLGYQQGPSPSRRNPMEWSWTPQPGEPG